MSASILSSKKSEYLSSSVQYPGTVKEKSALNVPLGEDVFAPRPCRYQKRPFGVDTHFAFPLEFRSIQPKTKGISFAFFLYYRFFGEGSRERGYILPARFPPKLNVTKKGIFLFFAGNGGHSS